MRPRKFYPSINISHYEELTALIPLLKQEKRIAKNLDNEKTLMMSNFYQCIMNCNSNLSKKNYSLFNLESDLYIQVMQIGTKGGGYKGPYRCFKITYRNNNYIAGLGLNCFKNKFRTLICVALQKEGYKPHHSLQLSVDDYVTIYDNICNFTHKGSIGLGKLGTGIKSVLRENYVRLHYPQIIESENYFLGSLKTNCIWKLSDEKVTELVENLITYSLLRDDYREDAKRIAGLI